MKEAQSADPRMKRKPDGEPHPHQDDHCDKHAGGHCWHQNGNEGFKGRYERVCPVICCHCKRTGKKHYTMRDEVEYD